MASFKLGPFTNKGTSLRQDLRCKGLHLDLIEAAREKTVTCLPILRLLAAGEKSIGGEILQTNFNVAVPKFGKVRSSCNQLLDDVGICRHGLGVLSVLVEDRGSELPDVLLAAVVETNCGTIGILSTWREDVLSEVILRNGIGPLELVTGTNQRQAHATDLESLGPLWYLCWLGGFWGKDQLHHLQVIRRQSHKHQIEAANLLQLWPNLHTGSIHCFPFHWIEVEVLEALDILAQCSTGCFVQVLDIGHFGQLHQLPSWARRDLWAMHRQVVLKRGRRIAACRGLQGLLQG
mmetsp:Transcript_15914/g.27067  ORF Transcript_15914/g.27067 Transcript_15914/m.27067 type:complete len:291 (-) Transcript_15914:139-1011(-)